MRTITMRDVNKLVMLRGWPKPMALQYYYDHSIEHDVPMSDQVKKKFTEMLRERGSQ